MFNVENLGSQVTDKISPSLSNRLNIENLNISEPVTDSPTEGKKFKKVFILDGGARKDFEVKQCRAIFNEHDNLDRTSALYPHKCLCASCKRGEG